PDLSNPFFSEIAQIVEAHARQLGYFVLTAGTNDDSSAEIATLSRMLHLVEGLIAVAPRADDEALLDFLGKAPRTVLVNRQISGAAGVNVDVNIGMREAMYHLSALGHSRIGYVAGPTSSRASKSISYA